MSESKTKKTNGPILTIEQEKEYIDEVWSRFNGSERVALTTSIFLYIYLIIVVLSSYSSLSKSSEPNFGKVIFWLFLATAILTVLPVICHYLGVCTFNVSHIVVFMAIMAFSLAILILFEKFDKRELDAESYRDPYSLSMYFLLLVFVLNYIFIGAVRKF
jgi:hypothetical protein